MHFCVFPEAYQNNLFVDLQFIFDFFVVIQEKMYIPIK